VKKPRWSLARKNNFGYGWSKTEDSYLKKNCRKFPLSQLAKILGRGIAATARRTSLLGLSHAFYSRKANDVDDILGKSFGCLTPYKFHNSRGPAKVWCHDASFNDAPDRLILASSLRFGFTRGLRRPDGSGSIGTNGYKIIGIDGKRIPEHRYVMEKHLGRKLQTYEDVHHKNLNRADNNLKNLEVRLKSKHRRGISAQDAIDWLKSLGYRVL
jgi:hypothetical protein